MSTETLTQSGGSIAAGPGIDFACGMTDQNKVSQSVDVNVPSGTIKFNGWGPSTGTLSNIVTSGHGDGGNPTKVTFDVSGTGNITGHGNDDSYSGSGSWNLGWTYNEFTHQYSVVAISGSVTLTYTD